MQGRRRHSVEEEEANMRLSVKLALIASSALVLASNQVLAQTAPGAPPPSSPAVVVGTAPAAAPAVVVAAPPGATVSVSTTPAASVAVSTVASTDGTILVHVDSPSKVSLERRSSPSASWEHACESPCDGRLPVGDQYRVVGTGMNESNPFTLDASKGDRAVLLVAPGTKQKAKIGEALLIGGAVVLVGSVVFGAIAACPSCTFQTRNGGLTDTTNTDVIGVATGLAVGGLATGIFGAAWWVDNQHSRVSGAVQAAPPARGGLDPAHLAGMRAPMPVMTQAFTVPVFHF
jgi:hypothetical protein